MDGEVHVDERAIQIRLRGAIRDTAEKVRQPAWWRPLAVMTVLAVVFAIAIPVVLLVKTGLFQGFAQELSPSNPNSSFHLIASALVAIPVLWLVAVFAQFIVEFGRNNTRPGS
jgi:hypothetical protein